MCGLVGGWVVKFLLRIGLCQPSLAGVRDGLSLVPPYLLMSEAFIAKDWNNDTPSILCCTILGRDKLRNT